MTIFVAILFVLFIMSAIGHGIWLVVAATFRAIFGNAASQPTASSGRCAECGNPLEFAGQQCASCRHKRPKSDASPLAQLATAARQMDALLNQGKLDLETHRRVMAAIDKERERLTAPAQPTPVAASKPAPANLPKPKAPIANAHKAAQGESGRATAEPSLRAASTPSPVEKVIAKEPKPAPLPAPVQAEPRRSLTEMLETFMEESSIRWGELIGGLLIIGCSLALVISLWSQIKGEPLLKFSVFVGMTAALFGMGFYSAHRWRLPTTSRGALIISTLLVPLNFLAMTAFSQSAAPNAPIILGGELLALGLFLFLVHQAGNVIAPGSSWLMAAATLMPSLAMLIAKHLHTTPFAPLSLSVVPMASYWFSTRTMLHGGKKDKDAGSEESGSNVERLFSLFGIASFASLLPMALLVAKSGNIAEALHTFAPLTALAGVPAIVVGLTLRRSQAKLSAQANTAATSLAIFGGMLAISGLALAWPRPLVLICVALIDCLICAGIAWRFNLTLAHAASLVFFALAYLIGANVLAGDFPSWSEDSARLTLTFFSRTTGLAWLTLFVLFGAGAESWRRFGRKPESRLYEFAAFCSAFISLFVLTWRGFGRAGDPQHLAWVYIFYAVAAFGIAWYRNRFIASWIGLCLSLLAIVQTIVYEFGYKLAPYHPTRLSLLVYASLATVAAVVLYRAGEKAQRIFARPLTYAALFSSVAIAPFVLLGGWMSIGQMAWRLLWLAGIWLALSVIKGWPGLFTAFQSALSIGVVCGVAAIFDSRVLPSHSSWLDPHLLQAEGIALALMSLTWMLLRIFVRDVDTEPAAVANGETREGRSQQEPARSQFRIVCQRLFSSSWPVIDRVVLGIAWLLLICLSLGSVTDGMAMNFIPVVPPYATFHEFALRSQGAGSWLLLLALLLTFVVSLWEEFRKRAVMGMMTLVACACLLLAATWQANFWQGTLLPWLLAASFALGALPILLRQQVMQICEPFRWPQMNSNSDGLASLSRAASIGLFALPALALTALSFLKRWKGDSFTSVTGMALILLPLVVLSLTLAAHGIRELSVGYGFSAGLLLNLAVTFGVLLGNAKPLRVIQANLIASATFSLLWLVASRRWAMDEVEKQSLPNAFLRSQIGFTLLGALALLAVADVRVLADVWTPSQLAAAMGDAWGWLTVALPALAYARLREWRFERLPVNGLGVTLLATVSLVGCSVSLLASGWMVYHTLMAGVAVSAWLMLTLCWKREEIFNRVKLQGNDTSVLWATGLGIAQFLLIARGLEATPDIWWTIGSLAALCLLFTGLAIVTRNRGYVYVSGLVCNLAVTRLAIWSNPQQGQILNLILINVIALCIFSLVWLKPDLKLMRQSGASKITPFHRMAARISLVIVAFTIATHWLMNLGGQVFSVRFEWLALCALITLLIGCFWDDESDVSWRGLHASGVILIAAVLASAHLTSFSLLAFTASLFSVYALATVLVWHRRKALARIVNALRIPQRVGVAERIGAWLVKGNVLVAAFVAFCSIEIVFGSSSLKFRLFVTTAAFALPLAFALLAQMQASGDRRRQLIAGSIRLCLMDVLLWSWAWFQPGTSTRIINRLVIVMLIAEVVLAAYRLVAANRLPQGNEWRTGWRDNLWWVAVVGLSSMTLVLGVEVSNYAIWGSALISGPIILAVLITLVGLCLIGLAFALLPNEDPFGLDERGRMRYVYAVECFIVLTLMHVRVTTPWLFGGRFTTYWPLLVLALAFAGVGLSEIFRRQGRLVLAEPLERTGALLPLLPVIGFWAIGSQVNYSLLLLFVGLFYGWLSVIRHSFAIGLVAALAGNISMWHFLHGESGFAFSEHPQLWLIPAALSVLLATRITRKDGGDSLSAEQISSIRYGALMTIYVSSTADIFLNGVDESPWLPIVLAVLSVCGVAVGIMLRIRSFLFLGTAFLLLSMVTMIWSASVNLHWAWLWWVTGIALGVFILYTFAMFEKKREEMLKFVGQLKQWQ